MVISIDEGKKELDKIQHTFMMKKAVTSSQKGLPYLMTSMNNPQLSV